MNAGDILTATATSYPDQVAWIWDGGTPTCLRDFGPERFSV